MTATPVQQGPAQIQDRAPLWRLWVVTYPLIVTSLSTIALSVVDAALLGRFSTYAVAAVGLAAPIHVVVVMLATGWATAVQVIVARRSGADAPERVGRTVDVALAGAVAIGLAFGIAVAWAAPALLGLLSTDGRLVAESSGYLRPVVLSVPLAGVTAVVRAFYGGLGDTKVPMRVALLVNVVNIPLDIVLVYGLGLGAFGSGIGTASAVLLGTAVLLVHAVRRHRASFGLLQPGHLRASGATCAQLWRIGWPETTMLVSGYAVGVLVAGVVASLGVVSVASYALLGSVTSLLWTVVFASSTGVAILVGQRLGAEDLEGADALRRPALALMAGLVAAVTLPLLVLRNPLFSLFSNDAAVVRLTADTAVVLLLQGPLMVVSMIFAGYLRAAGDTKAIMVAATAANYVCYLPLAWLLGVRQGLGLPGVYLAALAFWSVRFAITYARYRTGRWRLPAT